MPSPKEERIQLSREQREDMVQALIRYFDEEREEPLGHLAGELMLRYILREIAPAIYNQGVRDAARYLYNRIDDLAEIELYEAPVGRDEA